MAEAKTAPKTAPETKKVTSEKAASKKTATKKTVKAASGANRSLAHGVGRRKKAVARVWLKRGKGDIVVNGRKLKDYFDTKVTAETAATPFKVVPSLQYDVLANVHGGGLWGQADAVKLGIARALVDVDATLKPILRKNGLLTVDARIKERKKYGQPGARRKFQFTKR